MLGPLEVRAGTGRVLEIGGARLRALLILLALEPGQVVTTARLADGLWGERQPAKAGNALQALVSRLRRAVPDAVIAARPTGYQLMLSAESVDVARFEWLTAEGRAQLRADPVQAAATLREALALWRGPALADVADAEFAQAAIARLDELRLAAVQDRICADLSIGVSAPLIAELDGLVVAHPLREPLVGLQMRALQAAGRRAAALAAYDQVRSRLVEQLGVGPSAELAALHLAILRSDQPQTRPQPQPQPQRQPRPEPGRPAAGGGAVTAGRGAAPGELSTNLRAELTSFVGRDAELTQVAGLLGAHRLTTLTGPGGAGKTRLAVEAARAELGSMPDGVWLVEFAPVTDPAEVAPTVLATLGIREQSLIRGGRPAAAPGGPADPVGRLVAALSGKHALLVLDNCEHLVSAVATLADQILGACPRLRIMTTSREPLNITGEALWPVRPLEMPPEPPRPSPRPSPSPGQAPPPGPPVLSPGPSPSPGTPVPSPASAEAGAGPATITRYASVQLLAQRARAVCPGFEVSDGNAAAVARICRALDGMPLAIELAAARFRAMSPEQIAARLDDRFRLLTGGSRTAMPRHQTLAAVVGWSWDLLDDAERALWRRLSVFAGGATLAAARRVCAGGLVAADQVPDLLAALVDKSILTVRHDQDGPRYRMLDIIRAYGQERLAEAGERESLRQAHAAHFRELAAAARDHLLGAEQLVWLQRLSEDQDNLHAAVRGARRGRGRFPDGPGYLPGAWRALGNGGLAGLAGHPGGVAGRIRLGRRPVTSRRCCSQASLARWKTWCRAGPSWPGNSGCLAGAIRPGPRLPRRSATPTEPACRSCARRSPSSRATWPGSMASWTWRVVSWPWPPSWPPSWAMHRNSGRSSARRSAISRPQKATWPPPAASITRRSRPPSPRPTRQ
jgi:predicted ATPase/DNA-binding SARP family transcriptional activator